MRLDDDLARWEDGVVPLEHVAALHPDEDVAGLLRLHERLSSIREEPAPDPARTWAAIEGRLVPSTRRRRRVLRPALLAAAAALLIAAAAFAASAPIREAIHDAWSALEDLVTGPDAAGPAAGDPDSWAPAAGRDVEEVRADLPMTFFFADAADERDSGARSPVRGDGAPGRGDDDETEPAGDDGDGPDDDGGRDGDDEPGEEDDGDGDDGDGDDGEGTRGDRDGDGDRDFDDPIEPDDEPDDLDEPQDLDVDDASDEADGDDGD